jgi:hypothetical protein
MRFLLMTLLISLLEQATPGKLILKKPNRQHNLKTGSSY